jgi:hypothetical protein
MPVPDWLVWLLPVPFATLAAIAWVSWTSRARGVQEPADSVEAYERFRAAMSAPIPTPRTSSRERSSRDRSSRSRSERDRSAG